MIKGLERWILYSIIGILAITQFRTCNKVKDTEDSYVTLINSLNDSVRQYKNRDSNNVSTISVLQTQSASDFIRLQIKDKEIQDLQKVVKDYKNKLKTPGGSVTNFTSVTKVDGKSKTKVTPRDTVREGSIIKIYPEYSDSLLNQWIEYRASMNKDTARFSLKVINKYSAIVGTYKKKPFVDIINYNPYSSVDTLRTYQVAMPKTKRFGIGFSTGATLNSDFKVRPYIGVGLNYNIIKF